MAQGLQCKLMPKKVVYTKAKNNTRKKWKKLFLIKLHFFVAIAFQYGSIN
jgi:hypothetical protein